MPFTIRRVKTIDDCQRVHGVAANVWGENSACSVPQLYVHATKGGVILLAENDDQEPIGFLFSFPARYHDRWVLWSHETAVLSEYVHQGIGTALKQTQSQTARELGYETIAWTFDPLVSRNAHFNLVKLGASITEYQQNVYGVDKGDLINQGIETDRFIAVWSTSVDRDRISRENRVDGFMESEHILDGLRIGTNGEPTKGQEIPPGWRGVIRTYIPDDFGAMVERAPEQAVDWRRAFRTASEALFNQGYHPTAFHFDVNTRAAYYIWTEVAK